jgi:hypothetical protein
MGFRVVELTSYERKPKKMISSEHQESKLAIVSDVHNKD